MMRRLPIVWQAIAVLSTSLLLIGWGQPPATAEPTGGAQVSCVDGPAVVPGPVTGPQPGLDLNEFDRSTIIDNRYFPLHPGTRMIHEGVTVEDGEVIPHRVVFTVTSLIKVIDGVANVAIIENDYTSGRLEEAELAFFAQANDGTVWHFGQYPEGYDENGKVVEAAAWLQGIDGAQAGITMKAEPKLGTASYSQGWGPGVGWIDRAIPYRVNSRTCVRAGCYDAVLVMDEFGLDEPAAHQLKYYAPGIGNVRVGWYGDDPTRETLELVSVTTLTAAQLAAVEAAVLAQERRAYQHSPLVYARTPPMTHAAS